MKQTSQTKHLTNESIISAKNQEEYTSRLENIIAQWEKRNKEDER